MRERGAKPLAPYPGVDKPWLCECLTCGSQISPYYQYVVGKGGGPCKFCGTRRSAEANRISEAARVRAFTALGAIPTAPYPGDARAPWPSVCGTCGQDIAPTYDSVVYSKNGPCKFCGWKAAGLTRRLDAKEAEQVMISRGAVPLVSYPGYDQPWLSLCLSCGDEVSPRYGSVASGKQGPCVRCGRRATAHANRHDATLAQQRMEAAGALPRVAYPGHVNSPWPCICAVCKSEISPTYANIVLNDQGPCAKCASRARGNAQRLDADLAARAMTEHGAEPLVPYPGKAGLPWPCICLACGKATAPSYDSVVKQGNGPCRSCGIQARSAKQRLNSSLAASNMRSCGAEPTTEYPGAGKPWPSTCLTCGAKIFPRYSNVVLAGQNPCKYCAKFGFDYSAPGTVYLIGHHGFSAAKVGIANTKNLSRRLGQHGSTGWHIVKVWPFERGQQAYEMEQAVLLSWRSQGYGEAVPPAEMPQGGWTETVDSGCASALEMDMVAEAIHRQVEMPAGTSGPNPADCA